MQQRIPNAEQQSVIDVNDENIILFASAGTGKTFTVAARVARLLEEGRTSPEEILCLTFTIKAAEEMRSDIAARVPDAVNEITVKTIHSFCFSVLREESIRGSIPFSSPTVCDEVDEGEMVRRVLRGMGVTVNVYSPDARLRACDNASFLGGFVSELKRRRELTGRYSADEIRDLQTVYEELRADSHAYTKLMTFYDPRTRAQGIDRVFADIMDTRAGELAAGYNALLRQTNRLDFDDLVCMVHRAWQNGQIPAHWKTRYKYIFLDEMQDTSTLEYDTLRCLFPGNHVMLCGDFFQTIYEWRHSEPEKVLGSFMEEFAPKRFMFTQNYRATRLLTRASFGYLENTFPELMGRWGASQVDSHAEDEGEKLHLVYAADEEKEAAWIYNYLLSHREEDPASMCLMARSNRMIEALYGRLMQISSRMNEAERLHFFTVDRDHRFYRRPAIKDILAFFSLLVNPTDDLAMARLAESYVKGVGEKTLKMLRSLRTCGVTLSSLANLALQQTGDIYAPLLENMAQGNVVIYDTETTGLDLTRDEIIQISAIRLNGEGEIADTMDLLVLPTVPISAGALRTHGKTEEEISQNGISATEALIRFSAFVRGCVLVGHNSVCFDRPLVNRMLRDYHLPPLSVIAEYDTLPMARALLPSLSDHTLGTCCRYFDIVNEHAHDALGDITATGKVLWCMAERLLIPQTEQRKSAIAEYVPKFARFVAFMDELRTLLREGCVRELAQTVISRLNVAKRYPSATIDEALDDLLRTLPEQYDGDASLFLRTYLDDAALSGSQMDTLIRKLNKIPIISVHQSKGCEFQTVILASCDDHAFPSYMAVRDGLEDEEKRLFYVAITRAKKNLVITAARRHGEREHKLSPYLWKLPSGVGQSEKIE